MKHVVTVLQMQPLKKKHCMPQVKIKFEVGNLHSVYDYDQLASHKCSFANGDNEMLSSDSPINYDHVNINRYQEKHKLLNSFSLSDVVNNNRNRLSVVVFTHGHS